MDSVYLKMDFPYFQIEPGGKDIRVTLKEEEQQKKILTGEEKEKFITNAMETYKEHAIGEFLKIAGWIFCLLVILIGVIHPIVAVISTILPMCAFAGSIIFKNKADKNLKSLANSLRE